MITRIIIENFQSHAHTELALSPAVTVLTGESDVGKSAVIRALRWLFLNEPRGANFVRRGAGTCRVSVEYAGGAALTRERTASTNRYIVRRPDGSEEIYEGFGYEVPEEVAALTGMRRAEANGVVLAPNLAAQLDPPFLVGETGSCAAAALGLFSRADVFDAALRGTLADRARAEREARALAEEVASLDRELQRYADLPAWEEALARATTQLREASVAGEREETLAALLAEARGLRLGLDRCSRILAATRATARAAEETAAAAESTTRRQRLIALARECAGVKARHRGAIEILKAAEVALPAAELAATAGEMAGRAAALRRLAGERAITIAGNRRAAAVARVAAGADVAGAATDCAAEAFTRAADLEAAVEEQDRLAKEVARKAALLAAAAGVKRAAESLAAGASAARDAAGLAAAVAERAKLAARMERVATILAALQKAGTAGPVLESCASLSRQREALATALAPRAACVVKSREAGAAVLRAAREVKEAADALAAALREAGRCPVCLNAIEEDDVREIVAQIAGQFPAELLAAPARHAGCAE